MARRQRSLQGSRSAPIAHSRRSLVRASPKIGGGPSFLSCAVFSRPRAVSSAGLERYFHTVEVRGSNPLQPTRRRDPYTKTESNSIIIPSESGTIRGALLCQPMPIAAQPADKHSKFSSPSAPHRWSTVRRPRALTQLQRAKERSNDSLAVVQDSFSMAAASISLTTNAAAINPNRARARHHVPVATAAAATTATKFIPHQAQRHSRIAGVPRVHSPIVRCRSECNRQDVRLRVERRAEPLKGPRRPAP